MIEKFHIVNQYETHTRHTMPSQKIFDLDRKAFNVKRKRILFSSDYKTSGNFTIMELDGDTFLAYGKANCRDDEAYKNVKGDKSRLILKPDK